MAANDARLLRAVAEVEDKVAGCHALLASIDARLARIEASLGRLEGPTLAAFDAVPAETDVVH
jgi:hypothetical protein